MNKAKSMPSEDRTCYSLVLDISILICETSLLPLHHGEMPYFDNDLITVTIK